MSIHLTYKGRWNAVTNIATADDGEYPLQDGVGTTGDSFIIYADDGDIHVNIYDRDLGSGIKSWIALQYIYYDGSIWGMI